MSDWGDACLNEKARPRTWPDPPAAVESLRAVVAEEVAVTETPDPPLWQHDNGDRVIPGGG